MKKSVLRISPIKEMEIRSSKFLDVVSLAQGIPSFDTPECIKKKAIEAIEEGLVARYSLSPGILELREAIEHSLVKQNIFYDFEDEIIVTCGSIEAITASFLALLDPGDEVIIPDPTYTSYQSAIETAKAKAIFVPLDENADWSLDVSNIEKKITTNTKAILFCNPNNPTGTIYPRAQLLELIELAERYNLYVLADEVYKDFLYDEEDFFSLGQFSGFRERLIYIFSFSKAYAMTGWRVAFLAADKKIASKILGVHDAMVTCAPVVSQWAALAALEMAEDDLRLHRSLYKKRRDFICRKMDKLSDYFSYIKPSGAYFIFPKIKDEFALKFWKWQKSESVLVGEPRDVYRDKSLSWQFVLELLYSNKVALVPGVAFGPSGEGHLRLCFGRKEQNIEVAVNRLFDFCKKIDSFKE